MALGAQIRIEIDWIRFYPSKKKRVRRKNRTFLYFFCHYFMMFQYKIFHKSSIKTLVKEILNNFDPETGSRSELIGSFGIWQGSGELVFQILNGRER